MARRKSALTLPWPLSGLERNTAYRQSSPASTPRCQNVVTLETMEGRARGGSRPGLSKHIAQELGSGSPVNMLVELPMLASTGHTIWLDEFTDNELQDVWTAVGTAPDLMEDDKVANAYHAPVGMVRDSLEIVTASAYTVDLYIVPFEASQHGKFKIWARMDDTTPVPTTDGVVLELIMEDDSGTYTGTLTDYTAGVGTAYGLTGGSLDAPLHGWLTMLVSANTITVFMEGNTLITQAVSAPAGQRVGVGLECTQTGGACVVDAFRVKYYQSATARQDILVAASGGNVYREELPGQITGAVSGGSVSSDKMLMGQARQNKVYIADWTDARTSGTDGVMDATGLELTAASVADWTAVGIGVATDVVVITDALGDVDAGTYEIASVVEAKLTLASSAGGAGACSFRVERAPVVYDGIADSLDLMSATTGTMPVGCPLVALYRDRLVWAGSYTEPQIVTMSRQGDPHDYDISQEDPQRAVSGSLSDAGKFAAPLTAMAPFSDDMMVFWGRSQTWVLRGDMAFGGQIDSVSYDIGCIAPGAWTWTPEGALVFLSHAGLYVLAPGAQGVPESLSRERLPQELLNIDVTSNTPLIGYSIQNQGIYILNVPASGAGGTLLSYEHWFYSWRFGAFWPMTLSESHAPLSVLDRKFMMSAGDSTFILGGQDGYIRGFHKDNAADDGEEIVSYCNLGPYRLSKDPTREGIITGMVPVMAEDSGRVDWILYVDTTNETTAKSLSSRANGSFTGGGLQYRPSVRVRGAAAMMRLKNGEVNEAWAYESATLEIAESGKLRK